MMKSLLGLLTLPVAMLDVFVCQGGGAFHKQLSLQSNRELNYQL
jgi:hypothetical protein